MQKLEVFGAHKLKGQIKISGSKNASLPILAAIIKFSVAPTEIFEKQIFDPTNPLGAEAYTYPCVILYCTPSLDSAFKCKSIGLVPIAHPPGRETFAFPNFESKGPKTNIPARIVLTKL